MSIQLDLHIDPEVTKQPVPFADYDPIKRDLERWRRESPIRPVWQGD